MDAWPQSSLDTSTTVPVIEPSKKPEEVFHSKDSATRKFMRPVIDFAGDQKSLWTSPARVRPADATWLAPLAGITAGLFVTDRQYSASLSQNPATLRHYKTVSDAGLATLVGSGAGLYLFSFPSHNEHWRETGYLAGEAALNSLVAVEASKYAFGRERPYQDNGSGAWFRGGTSFPSEHSAAAWAIAGVIAHEYDGTLPKLFAYGVASAVSFSRIRARQHFPSDVFVGSVLGYLMAQSVYNRHHDDELPGSSWNSPSQFVAEEQSEHKVSSMGSPYVPLDSWIYPAIERLAALGYVSTASLGIRPWTRLECARLLSEAGDLLPDDSPPEAEELYQALSQQFSNEFELEGGSRNAQMQLESVYQRTLGISGSPLTDGYHFGQTILNDYGRPFQRGVNTVVGSSSWASMGPFVIYVRGEYEYAPSGPAPSLAVQNFISNVDYLPTNAPSLPIATTSHFQLLDGYVGMNLANWQMSFGQQSLWWGPSDGGTLALTNNAQPMNMLRVNRVSPFHLPFLGDIRLDFFIGRVTGQQFINNTGNCCGGVYALGEYGHGLHPQPFLSGARISFKFTPNFEFSMSKTTLYGGPGNPMTPKTFLESSLALHEHGSTLGDGRSVADFSYRIPKLRDWLTVYGEGFTEDEISPLNYPWKSVWQGGLYSPKLPHLNKLDLRMEGGFTSPVDFSTCNGCFYHNYQYVNGYTNNGRLMGTWIGRAAQGESVQSTYWLSSTMKIGMELRHRKIDAEFLPGGGTQNDAALNADFVLKSGLRLSGLVQYERWQIPLLAPGPQANFTAGLQLAYWPSVHRH